MGITKADLDAQRAMLARGEEKRKAARQADERERLRDTFAAAAFPCCHEEIFGEGRLTGYPADWRDQIVRQAYAYADAMLRERERTFDAKPRELSDDQRTLRNAADLLGPGGFKNLANELLSLSRRLKNHDASPDARASAESVAPQPTASDKSGNPTSHSGTGKQPAPPCVETDGFSPGSSSDPINRNAERESPRRECGESSLRDVARPDTKGKVAGGPEHHISEAQIDALECVVEDGRIVGVSVYGHLRSLLVKLRPEWEEESDRPQPIKDDLSDRSKPVALAVTVGGVDRPVSYAETDQNRIFYDTKRDTTQPRNGALSGCETVPDPDSRVWETPRTPQPHATPQQGSVQDEGSFRDSQNAKEPVAWAVMERDGFGIEGTFTDRDEACECRANRHEIVPLYRHAQPPLTDEEREAVEQAIDAANGMAQAEPWAVAALRSLLKRLA